MQLITVDFVQSINTTTVILTQPQTDRERRPQDMVEVDGEALVEAIGTDLQSAKLKQGEFDKSQDLSFNYKVNSLMLPVL